MIVETYLHHWTNWNRKIGLLENLALQDMLDGKGFAFIDPHGDSAERLLGMVPRERLDVIYFLRAIWAANRRTVRV